MNLVKTSCWAVVLGMLLVASVGCMGKRDPISDAIDSILPPTPGEAARDAFNVYDPDKRRRSVALLASSNFGHEEPYVRMYRLLIDDEDATVRATCVHALGLHGGVEDANLLVRRLNDRVSFVRWEAAKALQRIHNPVAMDPLIRITREDADADVRMAAATALGQYADPAVFQALVGALGDRSFGVVSAAHQSLQTLTGYDFGIDGSMWLIYADRNAGNLFRHQQPYVYRPYDKPRTILDRARFWRSREAAQPRAPVGIDAADSRS